MEHMANQITLRGSLGSLPRFSHENHGKRFCRFTLEVPRLSGAVDILPVIVESSMLDGANYFQRLKNVYIPIASPQIFYVIFLNIISSFKAFGAINVLTEGGPSESTNILIYALYSNAFLRGRFETACVYAMVLCTVIFLVSRLQFILEKRMVHYQ